MINLNGEIRLFINGEEYDFDGTINFSFESSNFSSLTFNNVIKKSNNTYPKTLQIPQLISPFTYAEVWVNNKVEFIGLVNDLGRFKLGKSNLKTFSIKISDYRKWLTLTKPIEKIYVNKTIYEILSDQLSELNEPKIKLHESVQYKLVTIIDFYSTQSKNVYQILKEVSERQSGGILYYYVEDGFLIINYKIGNDFENLSEIELDLNDQKMLDEYKILDIEYDASSNDYYNYIQVVSDNVKSSVPTIENNLQLKNDSIDLKKKIYEIDFENSFIYDTVNNTKRKAVFKNKKTVLDGEYYDFLYTLDSDTLEVRSPSVSKFLNITYYSQEKMVLPYFKQQEIKDVKRISKTNNGIVFKTEQYNDITTLNDLSNALTNLYDKYSKFQTKITVISRSFIWEILDTVKISNINEQVDGKYYVQAISGYLTKGKNNNHFYEITYTLNNSKNLDTLLNKYNSQVYRKNPEIDPNNPSLPLVQLLQYNLDYFLVFREIQEEIDLMSMNSYVYQQYINDLISKGFLLNTRSVFNTANDQSNVDDIQQKIPFPNTPLTNQEYSFTYNLSLKNAPLSQKLTTPYRKDNFWYNYSWEDLLSIFSQNVSYEFVKNIFIGKIVLFIYKNANQYFVYSYDMTIEGTPLWENVVLRDKYYNYDQDTKQNINFEIFKYKKQLWAIINRKICFLNDFYKNNDYDIFINRESEDEFPISIYETPSSPSQRNQVSCLWIDNYIFWNKMIVETIDPLKDGYNWRAIGVYNFTMYDVENDKFITREMSIPIRYIGTDKTALAISCFLEIDPTNEDSGKLIVKQVLADRVWVRDGNVSVNGVTKYRFKKDIKESTIEYSVSGLTDENLTLIFSKESNETLIWSCSKINDTTNPDSVYPYPECDYILDPSFHLTKGLNEINGNLTCVIYNKSKTSNFKLQGYGNKVLDVIDVKDYQLSFKQKTKPINDPDTNEYFYQEFVSVSSNGNLILQDALTTNYFLFQEGINLFIPAGLYLNNTTSMKMESNPRFWMATNSGEITTYDTTITGLMVNNKMLIKSAVSVKVGEGTFSLFKIPLGVALDGSEESNLLNANGDEIFRGWRGYLSIIKNYYDTLDLYISTPSINCKLASTKLNSLNDLDNLSEFPIMENATLNYPNLKTSITKALGNNQLNGYKYSPIWFRFIYNNSTVGRLLKINDFECAKFTSGILVNNRRNVPVTGIYLFGEDMGTLIGYYELNIPSGKAKYIMFNDEFWI